MGVDESLGTSGKTMGSARATATGAAREHGFDAFDVFDLLGNG